MAWADEVWPYINGKALMQGRNLVEMEASDMMDCLHFLFEEDFTAINEDHAQSRSAIRDHLYTELYGVKYSFKMPPRKDARGRSVGASGSNEFDYSEFEASLANETASFDPRKKDAFSPRDKPLETTGKKIKFVDASTVPVNQTFDPNEALG